MALVRLGFFRSSLHRHRSASSALKYHHFRCLLAHPVKKETGRSAALLLALGYPLARSDREEPLQLMPPIGRSPCRLLPIGGMSSTLSRDRVGQGVWLGRYVCQTVTQVSQASSARTETSRGAKGEKARSISIFCTNTDRESVAHWSFLSGDLRSAERCQKGYHTDNWLVAAKRSLRNRFLILRCRLFLSLWSRIRQALGCLPTDREDELGLDCRETS